MKRFFLFSICGSAVILSINVGFYWAGLHRPEAIDSLISADYFSSLSRQKEQDLEIGLPRQTYEEDMDKESIMTIEAKDKQSLQHELTANSVRGTVTSPQEQIVSKHESTQQQPLLAPGAFSADPHFPIPTMQRLQIPRSKVLVGIISADTRNDRTYRKRHRLLFGLWNDTRVCSLPEFEKSPEYNACELIYTFILGGNPDASTELVDDSRPILAPKIKDPLGPDVNNDDVTLLNIKENMNEGKSQTFFYFATTIMEKYGNIDYAMKCDVDAILHLHDYFIFAHNNLPPAPYNANIYVGALRDKAYWPKHKPEDMPRFESFWGNEYEGVHLYIAGQCYIMSRDLSAFVAKEAVNAQPYVEGHEDHDISAMAFHSPTPIHMIPIGKSQRFWEHPVKGEPRWRRIWEREQCRMSNKKFEGKTLRFY